MVGWLIEQQYVRTLQEEFGQLDSHAPTATELRGLAMEVFTFEAETEQCLFYVFFKVGHVDGVELLAHGSNLLND